MIDPPGRRWHLLSPRLPGGYPYHHDHGDYPNTARAIAEAIGLVRPGHSVLSGVELDELSDEQLKHQVEYVDVFARVSPEHKMRIVDALRDNSEVVAMTGDGVNDSPSIKRADIGVAMGITGTDVAKESADMVLTDDNYASIVSAVEQGRIIYDNIRKFVFFLISSNVAEVLIIFLATLAGLPPPLTVIQLLWLNLLTDGAPALALAMEKGDPTIMDRQPRPSQNRSSKNHAGGIGIQGITQRWWFYRHSWWVYSGTWMQVRWLPRGSTRSSTCSSMIGAGWMYRSQKRWPS
jgi:magnesium-transporting ATPase (P-type)